MLPLLQGFAMGASLIIAIGAQNAFVLSQGVRREHHLVVALVCSLCDAALIVLGVCGMGALVSSHPTLVKTTTWAGAAFLFAYGLRAFWSAFQGGSLKAQAAAPQSLYKVLALTLALTLLNPHVYLDTVLLLGSISGRYASADRLFFGLGAVIASFAWFFSLAAGGRLLAPLFTKAVTWRVLEGAVGLTMWLVAVSLVC
ncbi:MAG: LysE/ArgO family amino acid transporter [Proteobacteria bacterium]|nr:LysE/ArgO family amino acid transporter [Pseudomonadota bacterium]MBU1611072.1 LysE/ArgO family amino acid transporter [Pseudomonadota bacterium]